jgi:hypothetical protein
MEIMIFLLIFVAGLGCGYYVRDRILSKQHERYSSSIRDQRKPKPHLLDFKTPQMREVWNALRNLPPPE